MENDLSRLVSELREETCPQRVLDRVVHRVAAEKPEPRSFRYAIVAAAAAVLALLCGLPFWQHPAAANKGRQAEVRAQATLDHVRVAKQAENALALIGSVLLDAGARSQKAFIERAVPPLRNGLKTTKTKLIQHIEL
jgi:hypothetical protein